MNKWLSELLSDIRFLSRKSRRTARVVVKSWANGSMMKSANGIASRNGRPASFSDARTSETMLTGEPAHFVGQNMARIRERSKAMGLGKYQ